MIKQTSKNISYDETLIRKLNVVVKRLKKTKQDCLILITGPEGTGKSTIASILVQYIAENTGRIFKPTCENVFFLPDIMLRTALTTEKQIIWWDEAALAGLAKEWQRKINLKLSKMLMTGRKKRHLYVFCIPKFFRLSEDTVDRAKFMIRTYENKRGKLGNFCFYKGKAVKAMYNEWRKTKKVRYGHYAQAPYGFHGKFNDNLYDIIDENIYEAKKDEAIASILKDDVDKKDKNYKRFMRVFGYLSKLVEKIKKKYKLTHKDALKLIEMPQKTYINWKNELNSLESEENGLNSTAKHNNTL